MKQETGLGAVLKKEAAMKVIGLTGGIGTGKSTVSDYLIENGFHVLDADKISREIVMPGSDTLIELVSVFGKDILDKDGGLNRKKLGSIVFSDQGKKAELDKMMHSRILEIIFEKLSEFREETVKPKLVFIDAALLFETGLNRYVDEIWVVDADDEVRVKRVMARDGLSREEIFKRISSQMDKKEKNEKANFILNNSGNKKELYQQVEVLLKPIIRSWSLWYVKKSNGCCSYT